MVYLVSVTHSATDVSFVAAKTRVSPLRPQTIPRLELLSALLLTRLMTTVMDSLQLQEVNVKCFTDSQVALYWIQGAKKNWKPFVQNRVTEIRRKLRPDYWYHCPRKTNPADLPSRGISLLELSTSQFGSMDQTGYLKWCCHKVNKRLPSRACLMNVFQN